MTSGTSMIETLRDFVAKMHKLGIEYMVTGSYAMSAYGEIRMTRDIDVVLQLSISDSKLFFDSFQGEYYINENSIRRALEDRSMFNIVSLRHGGKVDCILQKNTDFARESFERRYNVAVSGIDFWTTTREDLIIAKLTWARDTLSEMQIRDIANLTSSAYDFEYVNRWILRLDLGAVWAEMEKWKTQRTSQDS